MQVTETLSDGLKRQLSIVVPASVLNQKLDARLNDMRAKVQIKGFRPGKVPVGHLKRIAGKQEMAQIVDTTIGETIRQVIEDRKERPALNPEIALLPDLDGEKVINGEADLGFTATYELLPVFDHADWSAIELDRPVLAVDEAEVDEQLARIAEGTRAFEAKADGAEAASGDKLTINFVGKIDGVAFEGGTAEGIDLVLGSGQFIPGFEDQLVGSKAGESRVVSVTFPADYNAAHLANKAAEFDVVVTAIQVPGELVIDDEFAKKVGIESIDKLKEAIRAQIGNRNSAAIRARMKRQLLDKMDAIYSFALPEKLVEGEFEQIWKQATDEMAKTNRTFEDEGTTEEASRADYRRIAERRVRLGLVLSDLGEKQGIQVTDQEMSQALIERAREFPGQEREVFDYYRNNAMAMATLRAPIFEEKVVDHIVSLAKVTDKTVTKDELFAEQAD